MRFSSDSVKNNTFNRFWKIFLNANYMTLYSVIELFLVDFVLNNSSYFYDNFTVLRILLNFSSERRDLPSLMISGE